MYLKNCVSRLIITYLFHITHPNLFLHSADIIHALINCRLDCHQSLKEQNIFSSSPAVLTFQMEYLTLWSPA